MSRTRGTVSVVLLVLLQGCTAQAAETAPPAQQPGSATAAGGELRVAVVGDSITEADSDDFDKGAIGPGSWATYADGEGVRVIGGWAHAGATTEDMLLGVRDGNSSGTVSDRPDVLVLMGGSNDIDAGVPIPTILRNLTGIARLVHADRVAVSMIPPEAAVQDRVDEFNAVLPALARKQGWQLVDPLTDVRQGDGSWRPGMTDDGVHPTPQAAELIGRAFRAAMHG